VEKIKNEGCGIVDERIEKLGRYPTQAKTGLEWAPPSAGKWGRPVGTTPPSTGSDRLFAKGAKDGARHCVGNAREDQKPGTPPGNNLRLPSTPLAILFSLGDDRLEVMSVTDELEDYKQKRAQEKDNRERIAAQIKPEWAILKSEAESLVMDGQEIDGDRFEWFSDQNGPALILGQVGAIFQDRQRNGKLEECGVRFDRKPLGPNQVWVDPKRPFQPLAWSFTLAPRGEDLLWLVQLQGEPLSSSALAKKIAVRLAEYHQQYKKHYENWWPGKTG